MNDIQYERQNWYKRCHGKCRIYISLGYVINPHISLGYAITPPISLRYVITPCILLGYAITTIIRL